MMKKKYQVHWLVVLVSQSVYGIATVNLPTITPAASPTAPAPAATVTSVEKPSVVTPVKAVESVTPAPITPVTPAPITPTVKPVTPVVATPVTTTSTPTPVAQAITPVTVPTPVVHSAPVMQNSTSTAPSTGTQAVPRTEENKPVSRVQYTAESSQEGKKSQSPVSYSSSEIEPEVSKLNTMEVTSTGNWLLKRAWWEKTEDVYEQLKDVVAKIAEMHTHFLSQRNDADRMTDICFSEVGLEQGELYDIINHIREVMDRDKTQNVTSSEDQELANIVVGKERDLDQIKVDVKAIDEISKKLDESLDLFFSQLDTCNKYEQKAWENFKNIARELDDKEARKLYYNTEALFKDVKEIESYLEHDFSNYFSTLIQSIRENTQKISSQVNGLKSSGVDLKKELHKLETQNSAQFKQEMVKKKKEEERRKAIEEKKKAEEEKRKSTWYYPILHFSESFFKSFTHIWEGGVGNLFIKTPQKWIVIVYEKIVKLIQTSINVTMKWIYSLLGKSYDVKSPQQKKKKEEDINLKKSEVKVEKKEEKKSAPKSKPSDKSVKPESVKKQEKSLPAHNEKQIEYYTQPSGALKHEENMQFYEKKSENKETSKEDDSVDNPLSYYSKHIEPEEQSALNFYQSQS